MSAPQPYAGQEARAVTSLSSSDLAQIEAGGDIEMIGLGRPLCLDPDTPRKGIADITIAGIYLALREGWDWESSRTA